MVETRFVSMKRNSLFCCKGGLALDSPGQLGPSAGDERARRGLVLLAQCESHIRAEGGRKRREGTWDQLLPWAALGLGRAHNSVPSGRGSFLIWTG